MCSSDLNSRCVNKPKRIVQRSASRNGRTSVLPCEFPMLCFKGRVDKKTFISDVLLFAEGLTCVKQVPVFPKEVYQTFHMLPIHLAHELSL